MSDPIEFPNGRKQLVINLEEQFNEFRDAIENVNPETMLWLTSANRMLMEHDKEFVAKKFSDVAAHHLRLVCALGRELLGDRWDDVHGPYYITAAIHEFIRGSCVHCLMQKHQPDFHVVEDSDGTP